MLIYCIIFLLLFVLELVYFRLADRYNIIDRPNERSSHTQVILRGGGVIFTLGVWLWSVFFGCPYPWFMAGLTLIATVSFLDDIKSLPVFVRLLTQSLAAGMMLWQIMAGSSLLTATHPIVLLLVGGFMLVAAIGILNAYNFMDGINGITGGYSLAVLLPLLYFDTIGLESTGLPSPFVEPSLLVVTVLASVVFCFFNFRKKARCFAGDVGSIGIAYIVLFAVGNLMAFTGNVAYIALLAVYGVDSVMTILHRMMLHERLGQAHRKHAYQLLANELKCPHTHVSAFYALLQLCISFGLTVCGAHWIYLTAVVCGLSLAYAIFMKKYYHLHEEYLASLEA